MPRWPALAALVLLGAILGFLLAGRDPGSPPRAAAGPRGDPMLEARVLELERRLESLEGLVSMRPPPPVREGPSAPTDAEGVGAQPRPAAPRTEAEVAEDRREQREAWIKRFRETRTAPARVAVLRDAGTQRKGHADPETAREFYEEILRTVEPASEEGIFASFELGHIARGAGDYAKSDEFYRRVEGLVPADSADAAGARFQLAWNRKFTGDAVEAERLFRSVADAAEADPGTRVAAMYAVAQLRGEAKDSAGVKVELERLLEEAKRHPGHGGVAYYADLAKKLLATFE